MTLAEILKSKNIDDETAKAILDDMKANKIFTASEENLDIRYGKLKTDNEGVTKQLNEANSLIEQLKKSNKGNEDLQGKITAYEAQVQQLQHELQQTKIDSEIKIELLSSKALDIDYLTFKLKEKGELELGDDGKIKGWDDKIAALKTQFPTQFETAASKKIIENKLPNNQENSGSVTKEVFDKMGYQDRLKLFNENPEDYKKFTE